jgi:phospholipid transport system substrate-binding protein
VGVMRIFFVLFLGILLLLHLPDNSQGGEPKDQLKHSIDKVLDILNDSELKEHDNRDRRRQEIVMVIDERFDFEEITRRSLATHWKKRTPEEKKEFVSLFHNLLEKTYMKRIEAYEGEEIIYTDEETENGYSSVKIKIVSRKNTEALIIFRLHRKDAQWRIYDVVIEGISLVKNYRTQFSQVILSKSYDELVRKLREKKEGSQ